MLARTFARPHNELKAVVESTRHPTSKLALCKVNRVYLHHYFQYSLHDCEVSDLAIRYQINTPAVIGEVLDDEAIIVDLDSGAYYSLRSAGATLWSLLENQPTAAELIGALCQQYTGDPALIATSVAALLAQVEAEGLVRTIASSEDELKLAPTVEAPTVEAPTVEAPTARPPFSAPVLEKFTDMADLLLLDPIHEVDEAAGWPMPRA